MGTGALSQLSVLLTSSSVYCSLMAPQKEHRSTTVSSPMRSELDLKNSENGAFAV